MSGALDVYRDWLKIPDEDRPLNHYQLLRLNRFEDDTERIRKNYRKLNAHVRKYSSGEYEAESQALLNELAKAMLCLTDAERKEEYDESLGRTTSASETRSSLDDILKRRAGLTSEQLADAEKFAKALGMPLHQAVVQKKFASPEDATQAYAESQGVPYLDLVDVVVDDELLGMLPAVVARQHSCVPVMIDSDRMLIAAPHMMNQEIEDDLALRLSMRVSRVLCTSTDINNFINEHYSRGKAKAELIRQRDADLPEEKEPGKVGQFFGKIVDWVKENSTKK